MKIFKWDNKVNFVDENNVFVGYELEDVSYRKSHYLFTRKQPKIRKQEDLVSLFTPAANVLSSFRFDPYYCLYQQQRIDGDYNNEEDGKSVTFLLINAANEELYLTLYNIHNGHYSNGFIVMINNTITREGKL